MRLKRQSLLRPLLDACRSKYEELFPSDFNFAVEQCGYGGQEYIQVAFEVIFGEGGVLTKRRIDVLQTFGRHIPSDVGLYFSFKEDCMQQIQKPIADALLDYLGKREGFESFFFFFIQEFANCIADIKHESM